MPDSRCQSPSDAFDMIEEMNQIAEEVLLQPQRAIWTLMAQGLDSKEIAGELNRDLPPGRAPITERNVRYHRAQAQIKVREAYVDYREGKFRCAIVVEREDDALFKSDTVAQTAICNADRCRRKAA